MKDSLIQFIQRAREIKMTSKEKRLMIFSILGSAFGEKKYSITSPYSIFGFFTHDHPRKALAFAVMFLFVIMSGGTSYAAESSLPGETLYPIKVNVNEGIDSLVALTPDAKVKVEVGHAKRRLEEAENLSKKGQLNAETQTIIETNLKKHTDSIKENLTVLASENATATVKEAISDLTVSIEAHEVTLSGISLSTTSTSTSEHIDALLSKVNEVKTEISKIGNTATSTPATSATSTPPGVMVPIKTPEATSTSTSTINIGAHASSTSIRATSPAAEAPLSMLMIIYFKS